MTEKPINGINLSKKINGLRSTIEIINLYFLAEMDILIDAKDGLCAFSGAPAAKRKVVRIMEMKRNNICTKLIVAALVLSMGIGAGIPVYAAETASETVAAEQQEQQELTVAEKAAAYFANFPSDKHVVSAANLLERVAAGEDICVLDIRSAEDYAAGHIQGAINVPYGVAVAESLDKIPDNIPVLVYCYSGQTASQTIALLNLAGKDAYNVSGGFNNGISKEEAAAGLDDHRSGYLRRGDLCGGRGRPESHGRVLYRCC